MQRQAISASLVIALALGATAAAQEASIPAPGPAWVVRQSAQPPAYRGTCPATLRFVAEIRKGAWGIVRYRWLRSDGTRTPIETIDFNLNDPPKQVSMTWTVDPAPREEIWASLEITEPPRTDVRVPRAPAAVICTNRPAEGERSGRAIDPCEAIEDIGPITDLVRQCTDSRYARARAELARVVVEYAAAVGPEAGDGPDEIVGEAETKRLESFRQSQRLWEQYRDSACEEVFYEFWPGSMSENARLECLLELTEARIEYLQGRLAGDPDDSAL